MSNHKHYDSHNAGPEWATPEYIWRPLSRALRGFDLDAASGCESTPIANERYTLNRDRAREQHGYIYTDGLEVPWHGHVWVNPPYGREFNDPWAEKIERESHRPEVDSITALVAAATSTDRWHEHFCEADLYTFIDHRVGFEGEMDGNASFASVVLTFGVESVTEGYVDALHDLGLVLRKL